jgi:hypothetical protein
MDGTLEKTYIVYNFMIIYLGSIICFQLIHIPISKNKNIHIQRTIEQTNERANQIMQIIEQTQNQEIDSTNETFEKQFYTLNNNSNITSTQLQLYNHYDRLYTG